MFENQGLSGSPRYHNVKSFGNILDDKEANCYNNHPSSSEDGEESEDDDPQAQEKMIKNTGIESIFSKMFLEDAYPTYKGPQ